MKEVPLGRKKSKVDLSFTPSLEHIHLIRILLELFKAYIIWNKSLPSVIKICRRGHSLQNIGVRISLRNSNQIPQDIFLKEGRQFKQALSHSNLTIFNKYILHHDPRIRLDTVGEQIPLT